MDLHVHSCLSPCAEDTMTPPLIAARAQAAGLQAVGICDHNTGGNVLAVQRAGGAAGVAVLAGMELATAEEVHLLAFFPDAGVLAAFERLVGAQLPGKNDPELWGDQILADEAGEPLGLEERLLVGACALGIGEAVARIHALGGLAVASHIDKEVFSVLSQLGFIPPELGLDAVELSPHAAPAERYPTAGLPVLRGSDAHFPEEIGRSFSRLRLAEPTLAELALALRGAAGRAVLG